MLQDYSHNELPAIILGSLLLLLVLALFELTERGDALHRKEEILLDLLGKFDAGLLELVSITGHKARQFVRS